MTHPTCRTIPGRPEWIAITLGDATVRFLSVAEAAELRDALAELLTKGNKP